MRNFKLVFVLLGLVLFFSCSNVEEEEAAGDSIDDGRISLHLNPMQKQHQLENMRSNLEAIQNILWLIAEDKYDQAAALAEKDLGSSTEMRLMCASFGNKHFEEMGNNFHKSADEMSEIFKRKNKKESLEAISITMNYCVQCHATFRQ